MAFENKGMVYSAILQNKSLILFLQGTFTESDLSFPGEDPSMKALRALEKLLKD